VKTRLAKFMGSRDTKSRHENVTDSLAKALIANSPLGIYVIQNGQFKVISPRFMEITGYSEGELEKIEPLSLVYEEDRDYVRTAAVQMLKMERSSPYQFRIVTKQGDIRWIMETVASITYQGLRSALGNFMDITDQVLLNQALEEQDALLKAILTSSPLGIVLVENMTIKWANHAAAVIFGYDSENQLVGKEVKEFCASSKEYETIERIVSDHPPHRPEVVLDGKFKRKDGSIFYGEVRVSSLKGYGSSEKFVATLSDISWRKEAEASLAAEREWLAVTLRSIGDGVICTDKKGKVVLMNKVAEELTGWSEREAMGRDFWDVFKIEEELTGIPLDDPVKKVLANNTSVGLTEGTLMIARDGSERFIGDSAAPVRDSQGNALGVVVVFRDITARRALEREVAKVQKLEAIGCLAGGIAHDFNNLLMGILGNVTLAKMNLEGLPHVLESLEKAEQVCLRAKELSQKLITFSSGGEPKRQVTKMDHFLRESVGFALSGSHIKPLYDLPNDLWEVKIDISQIGQVIHNIVMNAVEAKPRSGSVKISAENIEISADDISPIEPSYYVKISIEDDGEGIEQENLQKVFDPFFSTRKMGRGLGLSIAHSVIKKHGGHIKIDSKAGIGTIVEIYLPAVRLSADKPVNPQASQSPTHPRVLLMDDEDIVRDVAGKMLEKLGCRVELARDGAEVITLYKKAMETGDTFDAVILDLTVPGGMGGEETAQKLKEMDSSVNAIASSGYSDSPIMSDFEDHFFSAAIAKPYRLEDLEVVINKAIGRASHRTISGKKDDEFFKIRQRKDLGTTSV